MLKKYLPFFILGPIANFLWAFWALPAMGEQGSPRETIEWIAVQTLLPIFFSVLIPFRKKYIYCLVLCYVACLMLYGFGILGWGLLGSATPVSVYAVGGILLFMAFGLFYHALNDLGFRKKERKSYGFENQ